MFFALLVDEASAQVASWNVTNTTNVINVANVTSLDCLVFPLVTPPRTLHTVTSNATSNGTLVYTEFTNATQLESVFPNSSLIPPACPPPPPAPASPPPVPRTHGDDGNMCLKRFLIDVAPPQETVYTKNRFLQVELGSNNTVGAYDTERSVNDIACPTPPYGMCVTDKTTYNETWNLDSKYETWEDGVPGIPIFDRKKLPNDGGGFNYGPGQRGTGNLLAFSFAIFPTEDPEAVTVVDLSNWQDPLQPTLRLEFRATDPPRYKDPTQPEAPPSPIKPPAPPNPMPPPPPPYPRFTGFNPPPSPPPPFNASATLPSPPPLAPSSPPLSPPFPPPATPSPFPPPISPPPPPARWWNESYFPHKSSFGHVRYAIIPAPPETPELTLEEKRLYTATTFEANAKTYRPLRYEKGVWAGVEVSADFGSKRFSVRVDNDTSPVHTLPAAYQAPVINTVALRVQAEGHSLMDNFTAYLASMNLTQNGTTGEVIPIPVVDPADAAMIGSIGVQHDRTPQMFNSSATSCIDTILLRSPDAKDKTDEVIYTQHFTGSRLSNSNISRESRLGVLQFFEDPVNVAYRTALQDSLDNDPNFTTGSFTVYPVNQLSSDFPLMCRNPYVTYDWELTSRPPLHSLRDAIAVDFDTPFGKYTPDMNGTYEFKLTVTAPCVSGTRATSLKAQCNTEPKPDLSAIFFSWDENNGMCYRRLVFNGTRSYDPDADNITYEWELVSRPAVSAQELGAPDKYRVTEAPDDRGKGLPSLNLFPDALGTYRCRLTVSDGCSSTATEAEQTITWEPACADAAAPIWSFIAIVVFLYVGVGPLLLWTQIMPVDPEHPVCIALDILAVRDEDETARALEAVRIAGAQQVLAEARLASRLKESGPTPSRSPGGSQHIPEFKPRPMVEFKLGKTGALLLLPYVPERPLAWLAGKGDTAPVAVPAWMENGSDVEIEGRVSCVGRITRWYVESVRFSRRLAIVWGCVTIPFVLMFRACLRLFRRGAAVAEKYRAVAKQSMAGSQPVQRGGRRQVNAMISGPVMESMSYFDEPDSPMMTSPTRGGRQGSASKREDGSLVVGGGKELTIRLPGLVGMAIWFHVLLEGPLLLAFVVRKNTPPFYTDAFHYFPLPLLLTVNHDAATVGLWSFILVGQICGSVGAGLIAHLGPMAERRLRDNVARFEEYDSWRKRINRVHTKEQAEKLARRYAETGIKPEVYEDEDENMRKKLPYIPRRWHQRRITAAAAGWLSFLAASVLKLLAVLSFGVLSWPAATTAFSLLECQYQDTNKPWPHWSLDSKALCWVERHTVGSQVAMLVLGAVPFMAVVSALCHHRFTPRLHVAPMFVLTMLPVKYAMAMTGTLYEASEGKVYADHVLQQNVEYTHDVVVLGGIGAHLVAHVAMQSLRGFSRNASNVRATIYALAMVSAVVSFMAKNKAGRGPRPETRGLVTTTDGRGGTAIEESVGTQEVTVTIAALVSAALMVVINRIRAAGFVLDPPSVIVSRGQYAMREGSADGDDGGGAFIRALWRRIYIGGVGGGSRRMFIIAYLGFFRTLTAEQRELASTGYGDAAAKSDLLVLLTRTFDLLIDRFPLTVLPVRREVGAHVGLALVRLMIRSDLINRRSLMRASKSVTDCLGSDKYDDGELLAELARINKRLQSSIEDEWRLEQIVGALRTLLSAPDMFVGAAQAMVHLHAAAAAVDHIVADDLLALRCQKLNHPYDGRLDTVPVPDDERMSDSCLALPLGYWNRLLLHVFAVNPAPKPPRGLVDMLVDGLDGTAGDGIDVDSMQDDDDDDLNSDAEAVSTAAIKALAAMAEGTRAEAAEMQRAMGREAYVEVQTESPERRHDDKGMWVGSKLCRTSRVYIRSHERKVECSMALHMVANQCVVPLLQRMAHGDGVARSLAGKMLQQLVSTAVQLQTGADILEQLIPVLTKHARPAVEEGKQESSQVLQRGLDLAARLVCSDPSLAHGLSARVKGPVTQLLSHPDGSVRTVAVEFLGAVALDARHGFRALQEDGTLARLVRLEKDEELTVRTGVEHITERLLEKHGSSFGAEIDKARYEPTDEEAWVTAAEARAETKAELGSMVEGAIGRHYVRSRGRVEAMKNNAKRLPSSPLRHEPMSASYYRHDQIREDASRAQGAAAQRWRMAQGLSPAGSPVIKGRRGGAGPCGVGGSTWTPATTAPPLTGFGNANNGIPSIPSLNLRSAGRDNSTSLPSSLPSLASTIRDLP